MKKISKAGGVTLLVFVGGLAACSDGSADSRSGSPDTASPGTSGSPSADDPVVTSRLKPLGNEQAFLDAWRESLRGEYERYDVGSTTDNGEPGTVGLPVADELVDGTDGAADAATGAALPAAAAPENAPAGAADPVDSGASTGGETGDFTTTNVQEQGVDEADLVKNDGEFLYILDQNNFGAGPGCLGCEFVDVAPVTTLDTTVAPGPQNNQSLLRVLSLQPDVPDSTSVAELPVNLRGGHTNGMFLHRKGDTRSVLIASSAFDDYYGQWNDSRAFSGRNSTLTRINVTDVAAGTSNTSIDFDGQVISSRRVGDNLIIASRYYPDLEGLDPYAYPDDEAWLAALEDIDLSGALPQYTRVSDGASAPLVDPSQCFVSDDVTEGNSWPDIITLSVFNANDLSLSSSACYLGASETLYASPDAVFLATTRWNYDDQPLPVFEDIAVGVPFVDPRSDTDIHQFDLYGDQLVYAGSGRVPGHLGWSELRKPFRMSEKDGDLRVATLSDTQSSEVSPVNLSILRANDGGDLKTIGKLPNAQRPEPIGKPGEQLYASRFLGDRGYLVTYRQTDPLYVLDLENPADPKLAGELEVEGYSDYLHVIDEDWLLGIGLDAIADPNGGGDDDRGGITQGVKVSLYDVSDASQPREVATKLLGQRGTYSSALSDHRAISILPPANGRMDTRVAFGIDIAGTAEPARRPEGQDALNFNDWRFNALHGLEVRTGADAGINLAGSLVAADRDGQRYPGGNGVERGVMIGDAVYYIYGSKVRAADWNALDNPSPAR